LFSLLRITIWVFCISIWILRFFSISMKNGICGDYIEFVYHFWWYGHNNNIYIYPWPWEVFSFSSVLYNFSLNCFIVFNIEVFNIVS
jgi:hypothetical protein